MPLTHGVCAAFRLGAIAKESWRRILGAGSRTKGYGQELRPRATAQESCLRGRPKGATAEGLSPRGPSGPG